MSACITRLSHSFRAVVTVRHILFTKSSLFKR
nr:MAG TPA: hypothetical protein [Bacteriophage sp.]